METLAKKLDEPPGHADLVEGNESDVDSDVQLAQMYVRKVFFKPPQRKLLSIIEGETNLHGIAAKLAEVPEKKQRLHPLYIGLRTNDERLYVKNFLYFVKMTQFYAGRLQGPNAERMRQELQGELGLDAV